MPIDRIINTWNSGQNGTNSPWMTSIWFSRSFECRCKALHNTTDVEWQKSRRVLVFLSIPQSSFLRSDWLTSCLAVALMCSSQPFEGCLGDRNGAIFQLKDILKCKAHPANQPTLLHAIAYAVRYAGVSWQKSYQVRELGNSNSGGESS